MKGLKAIVFILVAGVLGMSLSLPLCAQDIQAQGKRWKRFQIEAFGGPALLNPSDLNLRADFDWNFLDDQRQFYGYYNPTLTQSLPQGEFAKIKSGIPWGLRFRLRLSRRFSLSLGFKYFQKDQTSDVSSRFRYDGGVYFLDYQFSPYSISVRGYAPLVGMHFSFWNRGPFDFELFLSGGPLYAECGYQIVSSRFYSRNQDVYRAYETSYDIEGDSTGISLNSGFRIDYSFYRGFKLFCESGYSYQSVKNLRGSGDFIFSNYLSSTTKEVVDHLEWEGYWGIKETDSFQPLPSNEWEMDDPRVRSFELDLSGLFLRFGISFSFSLR